MISIIEIGQKLESLGYRIMPISFLAYFIVRLLEIKWGMKHRSKLVKALWYLAAGIGTLDGDVKVERLVVMMLFFDAFDSFIEYRIDKKE